MANHYRILSPKPNNKNILKFPFRSVGFEDNFNRDDASNIGHRWIFSQAPITLSLTAPSVLSDEMKIYSSVQLAGLIDFDVAYYPVFEMDQDPGKHQFSEITLTADTGVQAGSDFINAGPSVCMGNYVPQGFICYYINLVESDGWRLLRMNGTGPSAATSLSGSPAAFTSPSRWGLYAQVNALSVTLEVFKDGASQGVFTDSTGSRATGGRPGFYVKSVGQDAGITVYQTYDDYVCGEL
jgi:hypothetical protein